MGDGNGIDKEKSSIQRETILSATSDFVEDSHVNVRFVGIFTFDWCG